MAKQRGGGASSPAQPAGWHLHAQPALRVGRVEQRLGGQRNHLHLRAAAGVSTGPVTATYARDARVRRAP
jgi:hypothetical protein